MIGAALGVVLDGIETIIIDIEADVSPGLPSFSIVGLPDSAVSESKQRIRSAIKNAGFPFPRERITVNLSPASVRKRGAGLDAAIAVAILRAERIVPPPNEMDSLVVCAELTLSGQLRPVSGITQLALGLRRIATTPPSFGIATDNCADLLPIPGLNCVHAKDLNALVKALIDRRFEACRAPVSIWREPAFLPDMQDVAGLEHIKRALAVAAVGRLHVLLAGPPGSGKSMLAERFRTMLPPLTDEAAIESFALHQAAGLAHEPSHLPPLRMPHHSITRAGLVGGGHPLSAGEASLAHHGILVLDEFLEFSRPVVESLREPLVEKTIRLARTGRHVTLPASFQLIATLNPCPCGLYGYGDCRCGDHAVRQYWRKVSGPVLDRIDMSLSVPNQRTKVVSDHSLSSAVWRNTIEQSRRQFDEREQWLKTHSKQVMGDLNNAAKALVSKLKEQTVLSGRGLASIIQIARSIAALNGQTQIESAHIQEAASYRMQTFT